jgi:hypothetical protein
MQGQAMKNILIVLAVLVLGGLVYYFLVMRPSTTEVEPQSSVLIEQAPAVPPAAVERPDAEPFESQTGGGEPFESAVEPEPLPALADSDPVVLESLSGLVGETAVSQHVVAENIVPRVVATIDALTGRRVPASLLPLQPPESALQVREDTSPEGPKITPEGYPIREYLVDPANYERYTAYVALLESMNTDELLAGYQRYQPWFQQAYVELGYPEGDFNARLLAVIDHLLDAPDVTEPPRLVKPEAYFLFADPQLEALTAGQKLMIRMGSSNAHRVKVKLAEFREALKAAGTSK